MRAFWVALLALTFCTSSLFAQAAKDPAKKVPEKKAPAKKAPPERLAPTVANYKYGTDSERQVFDFWQAKTGWPWVVADPGLPQTRTCSH